MRACPADSRCVVPQAVRLHHSGAGDRAGDATRGYERLGSRRHRSSFASVGADAHLCTRTRAAGRNGRFPRHHSLAPGFALRRRGRHCPGSRPVARSPGIARRACGAAPHARRNTLVELYGPRNLRDRGGTVEFNLRLDLGGQPDSVSPRRGARPRSRCCPARALPSATGGRRTAFARRRGPRPSFASPQRRRVLDHAHVGVAYGGGRAVGASAALAGLANNLA